MLVRLHSASASFSLSRCVHRPFPLSLPAHQSIIVHQTIQHGPHSAAATTPWNHIPSLVLFRPPRLAAPSRSIIRLDLSLIDGAGANHACLVAWAACFSADDTTHVLRLAAIYRLFLSTPSLDQGLIMLSSVPLRLHNHTRAQPSRTIFTLSPHPLFFPLSLAELSTVMVVYLQSGSSPDGCSFAIQAMILLHLTHLPARLSTCVRVRFAPVLLLGSERVRLLVLRDHSLSLDCSFSFTDLSSWPLTSKPSLEPLPSV